MYFQKHCLHNYSVCAYTFGATREVNIPSSSHKLFQNLFKPQDSHPSLDSVHSGEGGWLFELPLYLDSGAVEISVMWTAWPLQSTSDPADMCSKFQLLRAGSEVSALDPRCNPLFNSKFHFQAEPRHPTIFWAMCLLRAARMESKPAIWHSDAPFLEKLLKGETSKHFQVRGGVWDTCRCCVSAVTRHEQQGADLREAHPPQVFPSLGTPGLLLFTLAPSPRRSPQKSAPINKLHKLRTRGE